MKNPCFSSVKSKVKILKQTKKKKQEMPKGVWSRNTAVNRAGSKRSWRGVAWVWGLGTGRAEGGKLFLAAASWHRFTLKLHNEVL